MYIHNNYTDIHVHVHVLTYIHVHVHVAVTTCSNTICYCNLHMYVCIMNLRIIRIILVRYYDIYYTLLYTCSC